MQYIDEKRVMRASHVQISENEAERLTKLGLEVPKLHTNGPVKFKGLTVGYANDFSGICIENKDFTLEYVESVLWYVNEKL